MDDLLFLVHRIPFPPTKGDKVRSYHLLEHLRRRYRIHLGTFVDDPPDWQHVPTVKRLCVDAHIPGIDPRMARVRSLTGLLAGEPLTLPYYRDKSMQAWVDARMASGSIARILVFSAAMAQYVTAHILPGRRSVIDFVDVDSEKWRQYAQRKPWPLSWIYRREGRTLLAYERTLAGSFDASVFVSKDEATLFTSLAPESAKRVIHINNGVDTDHFSPDMDFPSPYPAGADVLAFTGAMDYWANVDAVTWFADDIFPRILARHPNAQFCVVGARPTPAVRALGKRPGIMVTGTVDDVRPYIAHALACVAPLRIARGVQNKVLEALAMGKPVIATAAAMAGIETSAEVNPLTADHPHEFAEHAVQLLSNRHRQSTDDAARNWITEHYDWSCNIERFAEQLEPRSEGNSTAEGRSDVLLPHTAVGP